MSAQLWKLTSKKERKSFGNYFLAILDKFSVLLGIEEKKSSSPLPSQEFVTSSDLWKTFLFLHSPQFYFIEM